MELKKRLKFALKDAYSSATKLTTGNVSHHRSNITGCLKFVLDEYDNLLNGIDSESESYEQESPINKIPVASVVRRNAKLMDPEHFESWYNEVMK